MGPRTDVNSTLTKLKDESLQAGLKQSEESRTATQAYELAEVKSLLKENNALIKAAASETKEWGSRFDLYVGLGSSYRLSTDASL